MPIPPLTHSRRHLLLGLAGVSLSALPAALRMTLPAVLLAANASAGAAASDIALLSEAAPDVDPGGYLVSEKLDGVRAVWNGHELRFRSGRSIAAPAWFTAELPATALDGELWIGRGQFDLVSGTVRQVEPIDARWRAVRFMVFDAPDNSRSFSERVAQLNALIQHAACPHMAAVAQAVVANRAALQQRLAEVVLAGGEGLVLRRADSLWQAGRSHALLKLKDLHDAEAQVLGYVTGRGRLSTAMGALRVRSANGTEFRIGTGFTDRQRREPPPLGSWITYTYRGTTPNGVPRFASYLRPRDSDR